MEKEYIIFYGQLCEALIRIELQLRGIDCKVSNMANSAFRKSLFEHCKTTFHQFFDSDQKKKHTEILSRVVDKSKMTFEERQAYNDDLEKAVIFQTKLFGNNEFVGELYRRKLFPERTLFYVFESLLGMSDINDEVNDLVIEGAICLMDKIGYVLEENVNKSKKKDKMEYFDSVIKRFEELMNMPEENMSDAVRISNRVKLLIKNMFGNRASGWQKTKDLNDAGPKTKQEVQDEMRAKQEREMAQRDERPRDGGRYNDRDRREERG